MSGRKDFYRSIASIQALLSSFDLFRENYYADWKDVRLTCDTRMLMSELMEFLGRDSRIVAFQKLFQIDYIDRVATWYMGWIFPGDETADNKLPEKTLLQRKLKKYLLEGSKFGIGYCILYSYKNSIEGK